MNMELNMNNIMGIILIQYLGTGAGAANNLNDALIVLVLVLFMDQVRYIFIIFTQYSIPTW